MIQWESGGHPAASMPDAGCRLVGLDGVHHEPDRIQGVVRTLDLGDVITVHPVSKRRRPGLMARIETPDGTVVLE
ncbi:MAG: hypothetical protein WBY88_01055 [Desulfosarcina sp.]